MYKKINKAFNSNINSLTLGMAYLGVQYYKAIHDRDLSAVKEVKLEILYRIFNKVRLKSEFIDDTTTYLLPYI